MKNQNSLLKGAGRRRTRLVEISIGSVSTGGDGGDAGAIEAGSGLGLQ
jgi:hypothetical protein